MTDKQLEKERKDRELATGICVCGAIAGAASLLFMIVVGFLTSGLTGALAGGAVWLAFVAVLAGIAVLSGLLSLHE